MKKTAFKAILVVSVVFSLLVFEFQAAIEVEGNFVGWQTGSVTITFPENDRTYNSSNLIVRYHVLFDSAAYYKLIVYSLDGAGNVTIYDQKGGSYDFNGSVTLSGLAAGHHYIEIYAEKAGKVFLGSELYDISDRVHFNIYTSPHEYCVTLQSPQNGTAYSGPVLLNFTKLGHEPATYTYFYVLDGGSIKWGDPYIENIRYNGSERFAWDSLSHEVFETWGWTYIPLSNLTVGAHNLTFCSLRLGEVYGDFQTVQFSVVEPFPTTSIIASVSVVAVIVTVGLLVYFKKRK